MHRFNIHTADMTAILAVLFSGIGPFLGQIASLFSIVAAGYAIAYYNKARRKLGD